MTTATSTNKKDLTGKNTSQVNMSDNQNSGLVMDNSIVTSSPVKNPR